MKLNPFLTATTLLVLFTAGLSETTSGNTELEPINVAAGNKQIAQVYKDSYPTEPDVLSPIVPVASPIVPAAAGIKAALNIALTIVKEVQGEREKKSAFMKESLNQLIKKYPRWSVALIANGLGPTDGCIHQRFEMPVFIGTTRVDVFFGNRAAGYACRIDHFGDGGWLNWAYGNSGQAYPWNRSEFPGGNGQRIWV